MPRMSYSRKMVGLSIHFDSSESVFGAEMGGRQVLQTTERLYGSLRAIEIET